MVTAVAAKRPTPSRRVAVFGGDDRVKRAQWPEHIDVVAYTAEEVSRLADSISSGRVGTVVVLTKWLGHAAWARLKGSGAQLVPWPRGIPELSRQLPALLDMPEPPSMPEPKPTAPPPARPVLQLAAPPEPEPAKSEPAKPKAKRKPGALRADVEQAFQLDPGRAWTARAIGDLVGTAPMNLYDALDAMVAAGRIEIVSHDAPRLYRLVGAAPEQAPAPPVAAPPPPKPEPAAPPVRHELPPVDMTDDPLSRAGVALARARRARRALEARAAELRDDLATIEAQLEVAAGWCTDAEAELERLVGG